MLMTRRAMRFRPYRATCVSNALRDHGAAALDAESAKYAAALGGWVIDMAPIRIPPAILANDVKRELISVLEGQVSDEDLMKVAEESVLAYKAGRCK